MSEHTPPNNERPSASVLTKFSKGVRVEMEAPDGTVENRIIESPPAIGQPLLLWGNIGKEEKRIRTYLSEVEGITIISFNTIRVNTPHVTIKLKIPENDVPLRSVTEAARRLFRRDS